MPFRFLEFKSESSHTMKNRLKSKGSGSENFESVGEMVNKMDSYFFR